VRVLDKLRASILSFKEYPSDECVVIIAAARHIESKQSFKTLDDASVVI
jgi:hypothetical protein